MDILDFDQLFRQLNREQRQAVESIEGPMMVIAGPGTGKTQVIAMRIAQILKSVQLDPQNILALTFTEAGVDALRKRLTQIIGSAGYRVSVFTFHGFASELIGLFGYQFAFSNELKQMSEIERIQLLESIVSEDGSLKELRPSRAVKYHINNISRAIKSLKQEGVSPSKLQKLAERELDACQTESSQAKRVLLEARVRRNLELSTIYENFQAALRSKGWYDYEDIITLVSSALSGNPEIQAYCQERYQYILVDEYQDTNASQNRLVETLSSFFETPNLCVVGDDKQAIFRFQGASVANMLHFYKKYPTMRLVTLRENYRSVSPILAMAQQLIDNNEHQLANFMPKLARQELRANTLGRRKPILAGLASDTEQYIWIISQIKKLHDNGLPWGEIALICRTNAEVKTLAEKLREAEVPIVTKAAGSWRENITVKNFINILRAISNPSDDRMFSVALRLLSPAEGLKELVLLHDLLSSSRGKIADFANHKDIPEIEVIIQKILEWHQLAIKMSLPDFLKELASNVLPLLKTNSSTVTTVESLSMLFNEMNNLAFGTEELSLSDRLACYELSEAYHLGGNAIELQPSEGVIVSTVHGVKGMEFTAVLMVNVSEEHWNDRALRSPIVLPSEISGLQNWKDNVVEDERRLFYVGITRAKKYLFLAYSRQRADGRPALPCQFIEETAGCYTELSPKLSSASRHKASLRAIQPYQASFVYKEELEQIRSIIRSRPFSASDMIAYQACPRRYLLQKILRFPTPPDFSLIYGDAIHRVLEHFFRQFQQSHKPPSKNQLVERFREMLRRGLNSTDRRVASERGSVLLERYYDRISDELTEPVGVEYNFRSHHVELNGIWLTGKCDRIDLIDKTTSSVRITDYKTGGRAKTLGEIMGTTKNSEGELARQMLFYAVLMKNDPHFPYIPREFSLAFLDDAFRFPVYPLSFSSDQVKSMETEITDTWKLVLADTEFRHNEAQTGQRGCELCKIL